MHADVPGTHGICFDSIGTLYAVQDLRSVGNGGEGASLWKVNVTSGHTTAVASWPPALNPDCTWRVGWGNVCKVSPDDSYVLIASDYCRVVWKVDLAPAKVGMLALAIVFLAGHDGRSGVPGQQSMQ